MSHFHNYHICLFITFLYCTHAPGCSVNCVTARTHPLMELMVEISANLLAVMDQIGLCELLCLCCFFSFFLSSGATRPGCNVLLLPMSSTMWYIMQSIQSKYSLSERLIRTIAAIRSFPHDNVEDLIRRVSTLYTLI